MTEQKLFESVESIATKPFVDVSEFSHSPSLMKNVCVVLTAYDDEESIALAVKEFLSQRNVVSVIVVDNNSKDSTIQAALDAGAEVVKEPNQGYGYACMRGLTEALYKVDVDIIILSEGDMTFKGKDIWKLMPFLDDADIVIGSRSHMAYTAPDSQMDWFLLWGNLFIAKVLELRFFNWKFLAEAHFTDVGCTMRAINKEALFKIIDDLKIGGNHFSPHMMKVALNKGLRLVEVPITFHKRVGVSKGASGNRVRALKIGARMLLDIIH
jgi:glycosyltransferase involved in cell wall biosynthesis